MEAFRLAGALVFAVAAVAAAVWPQFANYFAVAGMVWSVVTFAVLLPVRRSYSNKAALAQEQIDTMLFELPWNATLSRRQLPMDELSRMYRLAKLSREQSNSWYPITDRLPIHYDRLLCQLVNLVWDARLRDRYARILLAFAVLWTSLGFGIGVVGDWSTTELLIQWFAPSISAILLALELGLRQREISARKRQLTHTVEAALASAAGEGVTHRGSPQDAGDEPVEQLTNLSRQVQDEIFKLRRSAARVPAWLYRISKQADQVDLNAAVEDVLQRVREQ